MPERLPPSAMSADEFRSRVAATGLTLKGVAAVLGVSQTTVQSWISARTSITAAKAAVIRDRLKPQ